jgi:hypothetical protein
MAIPLESLDFEQLTASIIRYFDEATNNKLLNTAKKIEFFIEMLSTRESNYVIARASENLGVPSPRYARDAFLQWIRLYSVAKKLHQQEKIIFLKAAIGSYLLRFDLAQKK